MSLRFFLQEMEKKREVVHVKERVSPRFEDITGTYDVQRKQPTIELVGIMHRRNSVYQALLPSGSEHRLLMGLPEK